VAKTKSSFLGKVQRSAHKEKAKESSFGYLNLPRDVSIFKEEPGSRVMLDIMPYKVTDEHHPDRDDEFEIAVPGSLWYKRPFKRHNNIGAENTSVVCPTSIGKKCPICEYRAKLLKEGANWQDDAVKALRPGDRVLYVVIPIDQKKYEEVPHIWDISHYLFQKKLNDELEEDEENGIFPDLQEGKTLRIRFSEEEFGKNKFADTSRIDFEDRDAYDEKILDEIPNLDEVLEIKDYKTLEHLFMQSSDTDDDEDDGAERTRRASPRRRGAADEEAEPAPRQRRAGRNPPPEDEEPEPTQRPRRTARNQPPEDEEPEPRGRRTRPRAERNPAPEEEAEEEEPEETAARAAERPRRTRQAVQQPEEEDQTRDGRARRTRSGAGTSGGKNRCPHGHTFGRDADEFEECGKCTLWEQCMEERERLENA
jgi:hypothetical protein